MSRAKPIDNSTTVSLFPFLAVLLCTMGALLVVLVGVSRSARDAALREASTHPQTAAADEALEAKRELEKIDRHVAQLKQASSAAEQQLRENQLRLGHLEEHMRRLHDRLGVLQIAAAELNALEEEHYDDRAQAEREIARLQRLIAETQAAIDSLKEEAKLQKRTYALIPYEGPNGTFRRPIYIECVQDALILQPEGIRITRDDLRPPLGPGNPLAAALRAARDHFARLHPAEGQHRDAEPYPLLVVRPDGLLMYDRARRAIESSDFEFGFELVEEHWELKYPVADPQLAAIEQQAIEHARVRQQALAAAAPRAYRHPAMMVADQVEIEHDGGEGFGIAEYSRGGGGGDGEASTEASAAPIGGGNFRAEAPAPQATTERDVEGQGSGQPNGSSATPAGATAADAPQPQNPSGEAGGTGGGSSMASQSGGQVVVSNGAPSQNHPDSPPQTEMPMNRGQDWALDRKKPNAVPIRRTIQFIVRNDHIAILPDDATDEAVPGAKRIAIEGDTVQSLDRIVAAVRERTDSWGMAGDGLFWRPVLILIVGPNGQRRAEDLTRLLKNSGLELQTRSLATNYPQGALPKKSL